MPAKLDNIDVTFTVHHDGVELGSFFLQASTIVDENDTLRATDIIREEVARIILDEAVETKDLIIDFVKKTKMRRTIIDGGESGPDHANHPQPGPHKYLKLFWTTPTGKEASIRNNNLLSKIVQAKNSGDKCVEFIVGTADLDGELPCARGKVMTQQQQNAANKTMAMAAACASPHATAKLVSPSVVTPMNLTAHLGGFQGSTPTGTPTAPSPSTGTTNTGPAMMMTSPSTSTTCHRQPLTQAQLHVLPQFVQQCSNDELKWDAYVIQKQFGSSQSTFNKKDMLKSEFVAPLKSMCKNGIRIEGAQTILNHAMSNGCFLPPISSLRTDTPIGNVQMGLLWQKSIVGNNHHSLRDEMSNAVHSLLLMIFPEGTTEYLTVVSSRGDGYMAWYALLRGVVPALMDKKVETEIPKQRRGEQLSSYLHRMQEYRLREETRGRHYNNYDYQDLVICNLISPIKYAVQTYTRDLWGSGHDKMNNIPFELTESQLLVTISMATKDYLRTATKEYHKPPTKWQSGSSRNFQPSYNKIGDTQGRHRNAMVAQALNAETAEDMVAALKASGNPSSICTMCDQSRVPEQYRHSMGECTTFANHVLAGDFAKNNPEMAKEIVNRYSNYIRPPRRPRNEPGQSSRRFDQHQQAHALIEDGTDEDNGETHETQNGMAEEGGVTFSDHVNDIVNGINAIGLTGTGEGDDDESYYSYDEGYYDNAFVGAVTMESVDDHLPLPEVESSRRKVVVDDIHRIVTDKSPMSRTDQGGGPPGSLKADRLKTDRGDEDLDRTESPIISVPLRNASSTFTEVTRTSKNSKSKSTPTSTKSARRGKQTKEKDRITGTDALKNVILKGKPTVVARGATEAATGTISRVTPSDFPYVTSEKKLSAKAEHRPGDIRFFSIFTKGGKTLSGQVTVEGVAHLKDGRVKYVGVTSNGDKIELDGHQIHLDPKMPKGQPAVMTPLPSSA